jgi:aconitase A
VRAVIAESFERVHRSNLIGMGVAPLQFPEGETAASLRLDGTETYDIDGLAACNDGPMPQTVTVTARPASGEPISFDAVVRIDTPAEAGIALVVLGGKEYGSGSSRDWAAKGTALLGVRAVIAESFERIHRSNLIGMGVAPLQFPDGETAASLGLDGTETYDITGLAACNGGPMPRTLSVTARPTSGEPVTFDAVVRIDTPAEADYYRNGGILQYVLRRMGRS